MVLTPACRGSNQGLSFKYSPMKLERREGGREEQKQGMAAGKQQQLQQQGMMAAAEPVVAWRLWRVVSDVLDMLRRGLPSACKLAMDLHLLLHHGKIAGRVLGEIFLAFHHGRHSVAISYVGVGANSCARGRPFSCRVLDPSLTVQDPTSRG